MIERTGRVLWGSNNIYSVIDTASNEICSCRIKGKQLKVNDEYNILVPGDRVLISIASSEESGEGMIIERLKRENVLTRWNTKESSPQAFAANIDCAFCVASPLSPPFRPRFIDRCLVAAESGDVTMHIVLNKIDQGILSDDRERLDVYKTLGYRVLEVSAQEGDGMASLRSELQGKFVVFMGQSGAGKSSLIRALDPQAKVTIGEISEKYNRGRHTTVLSRTYVIPGLSTVVDTPGVREFEPAGIDPQALAFMFPEIRERAAACSLYNCMHDHEPGCAVRDAALASEIHHDRYESYLRMLEVLKLQGRKHR